MTRLIAYSGGFTSAARFFCSFDFSHLTSDEDAVEAANPPRVAPLAGAPRPRAGGAVFAAPRPLEPAAVPLVGGTPLAGARPRARAAPLSLAAG